MPIVCPAVLAESPLNFKADLERVTAFAQRVQLDLADGVFAPNKTVELSQVYWPSGISADLHMMVERPDEFEHDFISLGPNMVIVHAESSDGKKGKSKLFEELKAVGIKCGLALLPKSQPSEYKALIKNADHILIFTGELGHYGGQLDAAQLSKITEVKRMNHDLEVGVDGGINADNAAEVLKAGADVLNVGGYIQKADDPEAAYATIERIIQDVKNEGNPSR